MRITRGVAVAMLAIAALAVSAVAGTGSALAKKPVVVPLLSTTLAPSVPTDPVLHGVTAGGAPWVLKASNLTLLSDGGIAVAIKGLVIPELGTPGPVTEVNASLFCGNETTPAAVTKSVPINEKGNATIIDKVALPAGCVAPVFLINPNKIPAIYIATSGFKKTSAKEVVQPLLATTLTGSLPTDPVLNGVVAGGAPWEIQAAAYTLQSNGVTVVAIKGDVIPGLGTPGPVTEVDAALFCGNETTPAAVTKSVPLNEEGDATIVDKVKLPAACLTPIVLINPNKIPGIYITASGFPFSRV
jgi:hypothetical protein